jgi:hypothetical protein
VDIYDELIVRDGFYSTTQEMLDSAVVYALCLLEYQKCCRHGQSTGDIGARRTEAHNAFISNVRRVAEKWGEDFPGYRDHDKDNRSSLADLAVELASSMMQHSVDAAREPGKTVLHERL